MSKIKHAVHAALTAEKHPEPDTRADQIIDAIGSLVQAKIDYAEQGCAAGVLALLARRAEAMYDLDVAEHRLRELLKPLLAKR